MPDQRGEQDEVGMPDASLAREAARKLVDQLRDDPEQQAMQAQIAERHDRLRAKYAGVDVVALDEREWREWLLVHHWFERDRAKGLRAQHRHALKQAAKAEGRPWLRNDPRAGHAKAKDHDPPTS